MIVNVVPLYNVPQELRNGIAAYGIRNALLTSIAPTGTISLFAGNVSSGIEPVFSYTYGRKLLMPDGTHREEIVADHAWRKYRELFGDDASLPDYFVNAAGLSPEEHVAVQAAAQKHVDSSISKTINVPVGISFEAFKNVYMQAYDSGCKGCATFRPNDVRGSVLNAASAVPLQTEAAEVAQRDFEPALSPALPIVPSRNFEESDGVVYITRPLDRPESLLGQTYKIKWPDSDHAFYITINDLEKDGRRRPFEVFINSKNMEAYAWNIALTRMLRDVFSRGGDVSFVVDELKAVFDPRGGQWMGGQYVPSLLAAIGDVIERHLVATGFMPPRDRLARPETAESVAVAAGERRGRSCPRCGSPTFIRQENCDVCLTCGFSRCG
jgi:ribonucleoside-diphosphate reductase alpha chain